MTSPIPLQGKLQLQLMSALWRLESGSVEDIRRELPRRYRGAYTTIQTVLNRLAEHGLLSRRRRGNAIIYRPRLSEAEYLSTAIDRTLAGASAEARQVALAQLVGKLDGEELVKLKRLAGEVEGRRSRGR